MNIPDPQKSPVERQLVVKTKTIGSTGAELPDESFKAKLEAQKKIRDKGQNQDSTSEQALKAREKMLERAGERRHLKYDVIDDAAIIQMSVINSEDGTVVRKVPPDKVVEFVGNVRKNKKKQNSSRLDLKA